MSNVEIVSDKSFSDEDRKILDRFVEFQQALIDKDEDKLNSILTEKYELVHMSGKKQTKQEFIAEIMDGTLNYYRSEIIDPTILWDDGERPTLVADVMLTAKVYGINGKWTLDTTVDFEKIDGEWYFSKWDN